LNAKAIENLVVKNEWSICCIDIARSKEGD
jgi:hypothetical protein